MPFTSAEVAAVGQAATALVGIAGVAGTYLVGGRGAAELAREARAHEMFLLDRAERREAAVLFLAAVGRFAAALPRAAEAMREWPGLLVGGAMSTPAPPEIDTFFEVQDEMDRAVDLVMLTGTPKVREATLAIQLDCAEIGSMVIHDGSWRYPSLPLKVALFDAMASNQRAEV